MAELSLIVHIFAAIAFVALSFWAARNLAELKFARLLLASVGKGQSQFIYVDWPQRFLRRFCGVLQLRFEDHSQSVSKGLRPSPIHAKTLLEFYAHAGIQLVHCEAREVNLHVTLYISDQTAMTEKWEKALSEAFGKQTQVRLALAQEAKVS